MITRLQQHNCRFQISELRFQFRTAVEPAICVQSRAEASGARNAVAKWHGLKAVPYNRVGDNPVGDNPCRGRSSDRPFEVVRLHRELDGLISQESL
jgi:hypothetical protein